MRSLSGVDEEKVDDTTRTRIEIEFLEPRQQGMESRSGEKCTEPSSVNSMYHIWRYLGLVQRKAGIQQSSDHTTIIPVIQLHSTPTSRRINTYHNPMDGTPHQPRSPFLSSCTTTSRTVFPAKARCSSSGSGPRSTSAGYGLV